MPIFDRPKESVPPEYLVSSTEPPLSSDVVNPTEDVRTFFTTSLMNKDKDEHKKDQDRNSNSKLNSMDISPCGHVQPQQQFQQQQQQQFQQQQSPLDQQPEQQQYHPPSSQLLYPSPSEVGVEEGHSDVNLHSLAAETTTHYAPHQHQQQHQQQHPPASATLQSQSQPPQHHEVLPGLGYSGRGENDQQQHAQQQHAQQQQSVVSIASKREYQDLMSEFHALMDEVTTLQLHLALLCFQEHQS